MTPTDQSRNGHTTSEDLAAYLDGEVRPEERARIHAHLDDCESCREETADLIVLLERRSRRKLRRFAVPFAAVAAVAGILLVGPALQEGSEESVERLRGSDAAARAEAVLDIRVVNPTPQAVVELASLEFAWEGVEEEALYRFTITDESGEPLWSHETFATSVSLPSEVELRSGQSYFWFVDVLLADGRTGTTGVLSFRVSG